MNIINTHAHYKQLTLLGYIIERMSILRAVRVSDYENVCCLGKYK